MPLIRKSFTNFQLHTSLIFVYFAHSLIYFLQQSIRFSPFFGFCFRALARFSALCQTSDVLPVFCFAPLLLRVQRLRQAVRSSVLASAAVFKTRQIGACGRFRATPAHQKRCPSRIEKNIFHDSLFFQLRRLLIRLTTHDSVKLMAKYTRNANPNSTNTSVT